MQICIHSTYDLMVVFSFVNTITAKPYPPMAKGNEKMVFIKSTLPICVAIIYVLFFAWYVITHTSIFHSNHVDESQLLQKVEFHQKSYRTYEEALRERAHKNVVYLLPVDFSYQSMALNAYLTSLARFSISNYLFVGMDNTTCPALQNQHIACFPFVQTSLVIDGNIASVYGTVSFKRKTHIKTKLALDALELGLTVILMDVDIAFLRDPMPFLKCAGCDMMIQSDVYAVNSGFYLAYPTPASLKLHQRAWQLATSPLGSQKSNQKILNGLIKEMKMTKKLHIKVLNSHLFAPGLIYFDQKKRRFYFDNAQHKEVLVHNNWIYTSAAKMYRFKEQLLWKVDTNGYYTDTTRKYIYFGNPLLFDDCSETVDAETSSLKAALAMGYILNRTVILPTFTCCRPHIASAAKMNNGCPLHFNYKVAVFDQAFGGQYREHVFLHNELVPNKYKKKVETFIIANGMHATNVHSDVTVKTPAGSKGATEEELVRWFKKNLQPVLTFHSLYGAVDYGNIDRSFLEKLEYLQLSADDHQSDYLKVKTNA